MVVNADVKVISTAGQIFAMVRRILRQKIRRLTSLVLEIFMPILFVFLLCVQGPVKKEIENQETTMANDLLATSQLTTKPFILQKLGNNLLVEFENVLNQTDILAKQGHLVVKTQNAAEKLYREHPDRYSFGLIVERDLMGWNYTIRLPHASIADSRIDFTWSCGTPSSACPSQTYIDSGFLYLQYVLSVGTLHDSNHMHSLPFRVKTQKLVSDRSVSSLAKLFQFRLTYAIYTTVAYSFVVNSLVSTIVLEKEVGMREYMLTMGLKQFSFWCGYVIVYTFIILFNAVACTAVTAFSRVFQSLSTYMYYCFISFLYGMSSVSLGFLITPFFRKSKSGALVAQFLPMLFMVVYIAITIQSFANNGQFPYIARILICCLSPIALCFGIENLIEQEFLSTGTDFTRTPLDTTVPLYVSMPFLIFDFLLYLFLAFYFENVLPGEYGNRHSIFFLCSPSYWSANSSSSPRKPLNDIAMQNISNNHENVETVSQDFFGKESITITSLSKKFHLKSSDEPVTAVNLLTLDIYEGHITCILGHNGAGKSTLIRILSGSLPPTHGTAIAYGFDVSSRADIDHLRTLIGVCPQQDIVFNELTCYEHLDFVARVKGIPSSRLQSSILQTLEKTDLSHQANTRANILSGGQKRKLCVAMAVIGEPRLLFLDEPSSSLDPVSRRSLWQLLRELRVGRTIILSTQLMDEADILADRKVVLSKGILKCCGSSLYLKTRFGAGYILSIDLKQPSDGPLILQHIQSVICTASLRQSLGNQTSISLPFDTMDSFPDLFHELDRSDRILNYGVSLTSLEEVFLSLEDEEDIADETESNRNPRHFENSNHKILSANNATHTFMLSVFALCSVRFAIMKRNKVSVLGRLIVPLILVIIGCLIATSFSSKVTKPSTSPHLVSFNARTDLAHKYFKKLLFQGDNSSTSIAFQKSLSKYIAGTVITNKCTQMCLGFSLNSSTTENHSSTVTLLYNDVAVHSLPMLHSLLINMYSPDVHILINSLPWPSLTDKPDIGAAGVFLVLLVGLAFTLAPPSFSYDIVKERQLKIRSFLHLNGLMRIEYWFATFTLDLIFCLIQFILVLITFFAFSLKVFVNPGALPCVVLLFLIYIPALIALSYSLSFLFSNYETCQIVMPIFFYAAYLVPFLINFLLGYVADSDLITTMHILFTFIDPVYAVSGSFLYISRLNPAGAIDLSFHDYMIWKNNILPAVLAGFLHIGFPIIVIFIFDEKTYSLPFNICRRSAVDSNSNVEDADVLNERSRVRANYESSTLPISVCGLRKTFMLNKKVTHVVDGIDFEVGSGEIFGLLGPNGAGKSTTINLIVGNLKPSSGHIKIQGVELTSRSAEFLHRQTGYTPQFDALWDYVTFREHLEMYCRIKGINERDTAAMIRHLNSQFDTEEHVDKIAKQLSGGTKRKLSFAISMIGYPHLVIMDEPCSGMDPKAKRHMWNLMNTLFRSQDRAALLCTHYMEEAEALCSKIGIMVNGSLRCLGSCQHLKNRFGNDFLLDVKLLCNKSPDDYDKLYQQLVAFVKKQFPSAEIVENIDLRVLFRLQKRDNPGFARVFTVLRDHKQQLSIDEYSFSQSSLEHVFLTLSKEQTTNTSIDIPNSSFSNRRNR